MAKREKVLITGANGFIGSSLCYRLHEKGYQVVAGVRRPSGNWRLSEGEFSTAVIDLASKDSIAKALSSAKPDAVINCAAYGVYRGQEDGKLMLEVNYSGLASLAEECALQGITLVQTGSCFEFGDKPHPIAETEPLQPLGPYAESKAKASQYLAGSIGKRARWNIIRPFTPFGYREDGNRLVPTLLLSSIRGIRPMLSSPKPRRDFIFIEDLASAYEALLSSGISYESFNIGSGKALSVLEMSELAMQVFPMKEPEWGKSHASGPMNSEADISKAGRLLGWKPETGVRRGLELSLGWFSSHLEFYK
ncbi:MAG: NAD(P)-dependent oxidoreductase [Candidatus Micrarchaeia archaeon]